jgi:hypothetical protein
MNTNDPIPAILGFQSKSAIIALRLSALGFLAALGFLPGCHRLFGFSGFFGFIGVAVIIELFSRLRRRHS